MKNIFLIFTMIAFLNGCSSKINNYAEEIKLFQYQLNIVFADAKKSPLIKEDLKKFKGLDFYPIDETYKIEATLELTPNSPIFEMKTSTEELHLYKKYGIVHFTLNGKKLALSLYQSQDLITTMEYNNYLFLPFSDTTNGTTSYGGGRYLDLEIPETGSKTIIIDFNKAYNPYCAYNVTYSCPVPPTENNIPIEIPAGVKAYKNH